MLAWPILVAVPQPKVRELASTGCDLSEGASNPFCAAGGPPRGMPLLAWAASGHNIGTVIVSSATVPVRQTMASIGSAQPASLHCRPIDGCLHGLAEMRP